MRKSPEIGSGHHTSTIDAREIRIKDSRTAPVEPSEESAQGMAIVISFPEQNPKLPFALNLELKLRRFFLISFVI